MKKLVLLFAIMFLAGLGYAQTAKVDGTAETLKKKLSEKVVEFNMPNEITSADIEKSAQYYTDYFSVDFSAKTNVAQINLLNLEGQTKRVITRFLLSSGVRTVNFQGKDYTIMEFYSEFLE